MSDERMTLDEDTVPVQRSAIRHSEKVDKIIPALIEAQKLVRHVGRDATATVETKGDKPNYSYEYTTLAHVLDAIKQPLNENGLFYTQGASSEPFTYSYYDKTIQGMRVTVTTAVFHASGQWLESSLTMIAKDFTPQTVGSVVTYGRRYTAMPLFGLASEDDDGAAANMGSLPAAPAKKTGTKTQERQEVSEADALLVEEAKFDLAWSGVMEDIGEDDADAVAKLRRHFIKTTTTGSDKFMVTTDSLNGLSSKEVATMRAMLVKGRDKVAGHCAGDWREAVGLPAIGVQTCVVCAAVLTEKDKASCDIAGLGKPYCSKHAGEALTRKMKGATNEG